MGGRDATGDIDDFAESRPERHFGDPRVGDRARYLDKDGAGECSRQGFGEAVQAAVEDRRNSGEGLRTVYQSRLSKEAACRGVRRLLLGLAALALQALEQDRLFAEHVGALQRLDRDV